MFLERIPRGKEGLKSQLELRRLKEGVTPIFVSVISPTKDFQGEGGSQDRAQMFKFIRKNFTKSKDALDVDWSADVSKLERLNILNNEGLLGYVISPVDERRKFTEGLFCCTSLIVVGKDKETGKNISFITHQNPISAFDGEYSGGFKKYSQDLQKQIAEIKDRCEPGTIDALILGGDFENNKKHAHEMDRVMSEYTEGVSAISRIAKETLGFEPIIFNGPGAVPFRDDVYFDTENRRVYFLRDNVNHNVGSFTASQIGSKK